jgi:hypothetical protein
MASGSASGAEPTWVRSAFWGYWALLPGGIYFASQDGEAPALVEYFEFATNRTTTLDHLDAQAIRFNPHFDVSLDGRWISYVKRKRMTADIILVNNFR